MSDLDFTVRPLRSQGVRLESPGYSALGHLTMERRGPSLALYVVSYHCGAKKLGPLYDPRLIKASVDGFVFMGFEVVGGASFVQEWLVEAFYNSMKPYPGGANPFTMDDVPAEK